jgi:hypothetical protein
LKRSIAISLTIIFLLNVVGYYGLFLGLEYQHNIRIANRLDSVNPFESDKTFEVKVPLTVPYASDDSDFKRVSGQFEYQGEFYQMIKQKLERDTLTVVCLKDDAQKSIQNAFTDFVKSFNGSSAHHDKSTMPTLLKDYLREAISLKNQVAGWEGNVVRNSFVKAFISSYSAQILHPPERA